MLAEMVRYHVSLHDALPISPPDWVEPSMTLEEVEADPFAESTARRMRDLGWKRITRTQCLRFMYGGRLEHPSPCQLHVQLPSRLQDPYLTIDPSFRRQKWDG